jgi:hypothetical protein
MRRLPPNQAPVRALVVLAALATAGSVSADLTKGQCVEIDTAAQTERRAGHFHAARDQLQLCAKPACPKLVRDDCTQRLNELDALTPTLVFAAKDASGDDVVAVLVTMDGAMFATELSGTALSVDPGPHTFRFEVDGAAPIEKKLVLREGEKGRQERVTFADLHVPVKHVAAPAAEPASASSKSSWGAQKTSAVVVGGAGVAGVVLGAIMGSMSFSAWSSSKSECGTSACTDRSKALSDHDSAVTDATVSDIGFIAGGVLLAGGIVLFVTAPSSSSSSSTGATLHLVPSVGRGGGGMSFEGRF